MRKIFALIVVACLGLMAGCGSKNDGASNNGSSGGDTAKVKVVASTNVWAAVAKAVAGDKAEVVAVVSNANQDPHDYEATAQDKLAFSSAGVVIVNGGGYDDWATTLAETAKEAKVVNATEVSGIEGAGQEGFNEHVWYSLDAAKNVATKVADELAAKDSANGETYKKNAEDFGKKADELKARAAEIGKKHPDTGIVATEPVGHYLYEAMGLKDLTPEEYNEQSETDAGPSVAVVNETVGIIKGGKVKLLSVNPQTEDAVSGKLVEAAKAASVAQVHASELISGDSGYLDFVTITIEQVEKALG